MDHTQKLSHKRILLTGGTGLIGSVLTEQLLHLNDSVNADIQLTLLVRNAEKAQKRFGKTCDRADIELLVGDVCDETVFQNREWDVIVHAAGNAHPMAYSQHPVETMQANILGTMHLLNHARQQAEKGKPIDKLVLFSSGEIYGDAAMETEEGWTEDIPGVVDSMKERSCYPESKRAAETLCRCYFKEYGIPAVAARLGYIFGAGIHQDNTRADAQFLTKAQAGESIVLKSEGLQLRSYCYVNDAVSALILLMTEGTPGEAYNISNKDSIATIRSFAQTMANTFGVSVTFDLPDTVEKAGYSKMKQEVLNPQKLYDLGWTPEYSLKDAMQDMRQKLQHKRS